MKTVTKLWIGLGVLIALTPIGLILPAYFKSGSAWGEWCSTELGRLVGYVPQGLEKLESLWNAPIPGYVFKSLDGKGLTHLSIAYLVSAALGISVTVAIVLFLGRFLSKK